MSEKINNVHKILKYPFIVFHLQTHAENLLNEGGKTRSTYKITFDMHKFHSFYHEDHHYRVPKKIVYIISNSLILIQSYIFIRKVGENAYNGMKSVCQIYYF